MCGKRCGWGHADKAEGARRQEWRWVWGAGNKAPRVALRMGRYGQGGGSKATRMRCGWAKGELDVVKQVLQLRDVVALAPFYEEGRGLCSRVYTADGQALVDSHGPLLILRRLLRRDGVDFAQFRKAQAKDSYVRQRRPIVWRGYAFMTCKMQRARVRGDEAYGYIRIDAVARIGEEAGVGVIVLKNGERLLTVQKAATVERYLASGVLASYRAQAAEFRSEGQSLGDFLRAAVQRSATDRPAVAEHGSGSGSGSGSGVAHGGTDQSAFSLAVWMLETALQELRKRDEKFQRMGRDPLGHSEPSS